MKHLLKIGHWAPICPDIIPSIPFQEGDNLVIDSIPGDLVWIPKLVFTILVLDIIWTVGDEFREERHEIEKEGGNKDGREWSQGKDGNYLFVF